MTDGNTLTSVSAIDLFCGVGGLSYGLKKAGVSVVAGVDVDESCRYPYEKNVQAEFITRDIFKLSGDELNERFWSDDHTIKILAGCPPCQPFSTLTSAIKDKTTMKKWWLLYEFKRLIGEVNPHIVVMENVPNLVNQSIFTDFITFLGQMGFFVWYSNVYCPDYGIPMKRRRLILLASKFWGISLLPPTHSKDNYITVRQAIGHLPPVQAGEVCPTDPLHRSARLSPLNLQRIRASKPNGTWLDWSEDLRLPSHKKNSGNNFKDVYGRMAWDEPSPTITTHFYSYGSGRFGHPEQDRALTLREGAILQTFPNDFEFYEHEKDITITRLATHIGNAVPVKLAFIIGKSVLNHLAALKGY